MVKEDSIISDVKIKFKGNFDLKLLYKKLREWLKREGYSDPCEGGGEKKYSERVKPEGKQLEILWGTKKGAEAGYFSQEIDISFFLNGLKEVEVDNDGKKLKLESCEIEMKFNSKLVRNASKQWEEHSMMFKLYERFVVKYKIDEHKIQVYKDTNKLIDEVKSFFSLYRF